MLPSLCGVPKYLEESDLLWPIIHRPRPPKVFIAHLSGALNSLNLVLLMRIGAVDGVVNSLSKPNARALWKRGSSVRSSSRVRIAPLGFAEHLSPK